MGYCIEHLPSRISIGRETETGVTDIRIDCTDWLEKWPGMAISAMYRPPEGEPYIVLAEMIGNSLVWHVSDADTAAAGTGRLELTGIAEGKRKLSALVDVQVARRLDGAAGPMPEAAKPWADEVMAAAARITGMQVATETLAAGRDATAQWDGEAGVLTLGIPRGPVGPQGEKGDTGGAGPAGSDGITPAISVGTVTTLEAGSQATVTRRGTDDAPIFDFGIPSGRDGTGSEIPKPLTYDYMPQGYPSKAYENATLIEEQTVAMNDYGDVRLGSVGVTFDIQKGESYTVSLDGVEYASVAKNDGDMVYIGNETYDPFLIIIENGKTAIATTSTSSSITFKLVGPSVAYTPMDVNFIPSHKHYKEITEKNTYDEIMAMIESGILPYLRLSNDYYCAILYLSSYNKSYERLTFTSYPFYSRSKEKADIFKYELARNGSWVFKTLSFSATEIER